MKITITASSTDEVLATIAKAFDENADNCRKRASSESLVREKHALTRECNTWCAAADFLRSVKVEVPEG